MVENTVEAAVDFNDLGLRDEILRAVHDSGYATPTEIQRRAIPAILGGRNIVGVAQTGTGKTASFVLPMLNLLASGRARARMPRSLILSPTRELASQTAENFEKYGKYLNLSMVLIIGGVGMGDQEKALEKGVDVLIATPGRLLDWFERGKLLMGGVDVLVIDEADRMLDMGFLPDIERILSLLLGRKQTLLFSATMPPEINYLTERFMVDPLKIEVVRPATTLAPVADVIVPVKGADKRSLLSRLIGEKDIQKAIIFCNRKRDVGSLTRHLQKRGMNARDLHGDLDQANRQATLDAFKGGNVDFLVATDVAARGLDISDMPVVVNFDVPMNADDYTHRIGRTGRAGKTGRAFTFSTPEDRRYLDAIQRNTGRTIETMQMGNDEVADGAAMTKNVEDDHKIGDGMQVPFLRSPRSRRKTPASSDQPQTAAGGRSRTRRRGKSEPVEGTPEAEVEISSESPVAEAAPEAPRRRTRRKPAAAKSPQQPTTGSPKDETPNASRAADDPGKGPEAMSRPAAAQAGRPARGGQEQPVVGLGDHVPSFLLRPVPVKPVPAADLD